MKELLDFLTIMMYRMLYLEKQQRKLTPTETALIRTSVDEIINSLKTPNDETKLGDTKTYLKSISKEKHEKTTSDIGIPITLVDRVMRATIELKNEISTIEYFLGYESIEDANNSRLEKIENLITQLKTLNLYFDYTNAKKTTTPAVEALNQ